MPKLFIPGPVNVGEDVLKAMGTPVIGHRGKEFEALYARVQDKLRKVLYTRQPVYLSTSAATGLWEAVARNCCAKKALVTMCGAFSDRWYDVFTLNGKQADKLQVEWGKAITADMIGTALKKGGYDCLALVHNETSTGVMHHMEEIAAVMKDFPDVIWAVDAVSSLTGVKIETDKLGIDVLLASTQKCFGMPPGFAVAPISEKAFERAKTVQNRGWYFDFLAMRESHLKNQTVYTPSIAHIFAMDKQLDKMLAEGLEPRFARHRAMADFVRKWTLSSGMPIFPQEGYWSDTLTVVTNTKGIDMGELNKFLKAEKNAQLADGYSKLKGKTFRIPHMADLTMQDMKDITSWIEEGATKQGKW
jgi:predicted phosphoserine aminotransferase